MHPADDPLYSRLSTLSDAELFNYTHDYSHYKVEAVQAAIAELRRRGLYVSKDALSEIESYFTRQEHQLMRPFNLEPGQLRLLSYVILTMGLCIAIFIYVTAPPTPHQPLGYDPFDSKKYVHDLELYGGKINVLTVEFRQWLERLWRGKNLAYIIALLTIMLACLFWFLGVRLASYLETHVEKPP